MCLWLVVGHRQPQIGGPQSSGNVWPGALASGLGEAVPCLDLRAQRWGPTWAFRYQSQDVRQHEGTRSPCRSSLSVNPEWLFPQGPA